MARPARGPPPPLTALLQRHPPLVLLVPFPPAHSSAEHHSTSCSLAPSSFPSTQHRLVSNETNQFLLLRRNTNATPLLSPHQPVVPTLSLCSLSRKLLKRSVFALSPVLPQRRPRAHVLHGAHADGYRPAGGSLTTAPSLPPARLPSASGTAAPPWES